MTAGGSDVSDAEAAALPIPVSVPVIAALLGALTLVNTTGDLLFTPTWSLLQAGSGGDAGGGVGAGVTGWAGAVLVPAVALLAGVLAVGSSVRVWPLLLLIGTVASLPEVVWQVAPGLFSTGLQVVVAAGAPLVLVAVLAAAVDLGHRQPAPPGTFLSEGAVSAAAVGAAAVVAPWIGAVLAAADWADRGGGLTGVHAVLGFLGLLGAVVAVLTSGWGPLALRPEEFGPDPDPSSGTGMPARLVVVGAVAALAPALVARIGTGLGSGSGGAGSGSGSAAGGPGTGAAGPLALAVVLVVAGVLLGLLAGVWAALAAALLALVEVSVVTPTVLAAEATAGQVLATWTAVAVGLLAGLVAARTRWRAGCAAAGAAASGLGVLLLTSSTGGQPGQLVTDRATMPAALLLAVVVFTVATSAGALVPQLIRRGAVPVALGAVAPVLFLAGKLVLVPSQLSGDVIEAAYLNGVHHFTWSGVLLLAAALGFGVLAWTSTVAADAGADWYTAAAPDWYTRAIDDPDTDEP